MVKLGVNIDHVATLREARKGLWPDVLAAAKVCELAGAHQITVHLRQDRRHIQDRDVMLLRQALTIRLNLELGASEEIIGIARNIRPDVVCIVPENRQEITTEGGLDVASQTRSLTKVVEDFHSDDIEVSMFIDPELAQVDASAACGANYVEFHTGAYANACGTSVDKEFERLEVAAGHARTLGLTVNAGHGLSIRNLRPVAAIHGLHEVNIGHDIIARAVFIGLDNAVREILEILEAYSHGE
jgi:pyridoxine 5-phosphate synthase